MQYAETLKEPMLEVKRKAVLPRELRRIRASALTGDKKYGSVMDVLQIVYGQDFGAILKDYVDTHQEELYKKGIMPDSLFIRLGGIGKPYIETNYDQPSKAFFLDVVVDCLLDGEHYQRCVSFYIRYKMSFCAMDPRCFLWEISEQLGWNPEEEFDVWAFGELVDSVMVSGDAVKVVLADENGRESA
jgi:hypothetical protein